MGKRTKVMALAGVMLVAAFMVFMGVGSFAANPESVSVSAAVASSLQLAVNTNTVDWGGGSLAPGSSYSDSITATVNSNKPWSLAVRKSQDLTNGTDSIASSNLTYTSSSSDGRVKGLVGSATQFNTSDANVCSGCDRGANMSLDVNYSLTVPWDVEGGLTYSATHTYTATQP
jgi:hypothetical protein